MEIKESPNKGLGMFALHDIPAFTKLASDNPIMSLRPTEDLPEAFQQYQKLADKDKTNFLNFHSFHKPERDAVLAKKLSERGFAVEKIPEMVKVSSVFTSNAFNVDANAGDGSLSRSMFPLISRINHSCVPNAHTSYDPQTSSMAVYSISNIARDQEIEIAYFNLLLSSEQRQARATKWGFQCACAACAPLDSAVQKTHENRRRNIREIEQFFAETMSSEKVSGTDIRLCIDKGQQMAALVFEDESLRPQLPVAYDYIATFLIIALQVSQDKALINPIQQNLDSALRAEVEITGHDSPSSRMRYEKVVHFQSPR